MKFGSSTIFLLALTSAGLALAACSSSPTQAISTPQAPQLAATAPSSVPSTVAAQPSSSPPSAPTTAPSPSPTASAVRGPGSFDLDDPAQGLASLDSYRATLSIKFDGSSNNQPLSWSTAYTLTVVSKQPARSLAQSSTGQNSGPAMLIGAEIGGVAYQEQEGKPCSAVVIQSDENGTSILEPAQLLPQLSGAETAGTGETVAGLAADHYRFDQRALGLDQGTGTGEVWVASNGGAVLKYLLSVQAGEDELGAGISGAMQWDYELADVNQTANVDAPPGCPPGLVDVPRLDDATIVVNQPGLLSYKTAASLQSALSFYRTQLSAAGWQAAGTPVSAADFGVLQFTRGGLRLTIVITQKGGTTVRLVVGK